jgi:hypothetical protein
MAEPIGEVVQTSTTRFTARALTLGEGPAFGSLVRTTCQPGQVYGLVYLVETGGLDTAAQPVQRGRAGLRDAAIYRENPDLAAVLRTDFTALIVGFAEGDAAEAGVIRQYLPPHPPPLHWSVYLCGDAELARFSEQLDYLRRVLDSRETPTDELLAASVRLASRARPDDATFALRAGQELARLLKSDYDRLNAILRRLAA